jgi:prepilin-type N-terminal cleavage/methylation domain-containing protein
MTATHAHRRRGFTIIELLMVVVVVGAMTAIVVPRMRISEATEVQLAGMQLAQDMDLTRTRALSTRSRARVTFTTGTNPQYVGYLDTDGDSLITQTTAEMNALQGFGARALPARVGFGRGSASAVPNTTGTGGITFASTRVEFDSRGLPTPMGTAGVVYLVHQNDPTAVVAVELSPSGSLRLWTWKNGGWQ